MRDLFWEVLTGLFLAAADDFCPTLLVLASALVALTSALAALASALAAALAAFASALAALAVAVSFAVDVVVALGPLAELLEPDAALALPLGMLEVGGFVMGSAVSAVNGVTAVFDRVDFALDGLDA